MVNKYFVIGFNKTATTTIHNLFLANNIASLHHSTSSINYNKYQAFSDIHDEVLKFKTLDKQFPGSKFILNTRSIKKWIRSRLLHGYNSKSNNNWAWPPTRNLVNKWILDRNNHFKEVVKYFYYDPDKLIIIDIDKPNWDSTLSEILGFNNKWHWENKTPEVNPVIIKKINQFISIMNIPDTHLYYGYLGDNLPFTNNL